MDPSTRYDFPPRTRLARAVADVDLRAREVAAEAVAARGGQHNRLGATTLVLAGAVAQLLHLWEVVADEVHLPHLPFPPPQLTRPVEGFGTALGERLVGAFGVRRGLSERGLATLSRLRERDPAIRVEAAALLVTRSAALLSDDCRRWVAVGRSRALGRDLVRVLNATVALLEASAATSARARLQAIGDSPRAAARRSPRPGRWWRQRRRGSIVSRVW